MSTTSPKIAVVHLLRRSNGIKTFRRFIDSYRTQKAGIAHDLVIIFKGFRGRDKASCLAALEGIEHVDFDVEDSGFDIGPYLHVARQTSYDRMCFLNSFSLFQAQDWLSKLDHALTHEPNAGIVGATGSYERGGPETPFPNYHIRSNGFLIPRDLFLHFESGELLEKSDVNRFESGPDGLTRRLMKMGLNPYVVDCDGVAWAKEDWPSSNTFRAGKQEKLLIADNRTNAYTEADDEMRAWLNNLAWSEAHPGPNPQKQRKFSRRLRRWLGIGK